MTEDDTFRILKRAPYGKVRSLVKAIVEIVDDEEELDKILQIYGWTFEQFETELMREMQ